ncbi:MAG: polyphosphate kinase 1 [Ectothiorhodospiraceae bacterium]|nr:polyphosphate kinase 1 [Ectothiorhodospiraceae bacterium]
MSTEKAAAFETMNRELSWLSFNGRVLQEAQDPTVPLYERIKFLAIFSSNLDEFFRVRVASLRSLLALKHKSTKKLEFEPEELLRQIQSTVKKQQTAFGKVFREEILPALNQNNIFLITDKDLNPEQREFVFEYFHGHILPTAKPVYLKEGEDAPFLENRMLYLACILKPKAINVTPVGDSLKQLESYALVPISTRTSPRFIALPEVDGRFYVMFLDDVIRTCISELFPNNDVEDCFAIKLTRDADLNIEDEFSGDLLDKIKKGLKKRSSGVPSRFLYDERTPKKLLKFLRDHLELDKNDLIPGGRYHNFNDFFAFPNPGRPELEYVPMPPLPYPPFEGAESLFDLIREKSRVLYFPYHKYDYVIKMLQEAAADPRVKEIGATLYRVASDSEICQAMIAAAENGKTVRAFVEVKARFDEESNLNWAEAMTQAGVEVFYSMPGIKVHSKLLVITRREEHGMRRYAYLSTGNFNEKTARIYTDFGFFTSDPKIAEEAARAFGFIVNREDTFEPEHLLVAQLNMREKLTELIKAETAAAMKGKPAAITLKVNAVEDKKLIAKLYEASNAGVKITIICRGICCLVPGVKGQSENITVRSIVDRFLEHPRVYIFHNGGDEIMYVSSADWMTRNLSRRIEVAFPLYDEDIREEVRTVLEIQLVDNVKSRIINRKQTNPYVKQKKDAVPIRSQFATYEMYRNREG